MAVLFCLCWLSCLYSVAAPADNIFLVKPGHNGFLDVQKNFQQNSNDSLPKTINDTVVVPFEYQQSALNFAYTFHMIDSAVEILLRDTTVTLNIDGYSHVEEANNNICFWLSYNRAWAVKSYVVGRGVDSNRIQETNARSSKRSILRRSKKESPKFNCTAEIILKYLPPPPPLLIQDMDEDGIPDAEDSCVNEYGDRAHNGCPDRNIIIAPFEPQQSALVSQAYKTLDSVVTLLRKDPSLNIAIEGYAYKKEAVESVCERLSQERADIVKRYLLSRMIDGARILSVKGMGFSKPLNAARNSWERLRNSRAEIVLIKH